MKRIWAILTAWRTLQVMAVLYMVAAALDTLAWLYRAHRGRRAWVRSTIQDAGYWAGLNSTPREREERPAQH